MKKLFLFVTLLIIIHSNVFTQGCLPQGITFDLQSEIDNFQTNYPGCNEIEGDILIGWTSGLSNNISNLNGLSVLTSCGGNLSIKGNEELIDLSGLNNITQVGGDLIIWQNFQLNNLSGLENLSFIGGSLEIVGSNLLNLSGLLNIEHIEENLRIGNNSNLTNLSGLNNITYVNDTLRNIL